jgi:hypothetical protein
MTHFELPAARQMMVSAYRASGDVGSVEWTNEAEGKLVIANKAGRRRNVLLTMSAEAKAGYPPPYKNAILAQRESARKLYESSLSNGDVIVRQPTLEYGAGGRQAMDVISIILSDQPREAKMQALVRAKVVGRTSTAMQEMIADLEFTPQLAERYHQLIELSEKKAEKQRLDRVAGGIVRQGERLIKSGPLTLEEAPYTPPGSDNSPGGALSDVDNVSRPQGVAKGGSFRLWYIVGGCAAAIAVLFVVMVCVRKRARCAIERNN